jgi:hypothetical protein
MFLQTQLPQVSRHRSKKNSPQRTFYLMSKLKLFLKWLVVLAIFFFILRTMVKGYGNISDYPFKFNFFFLIVSFSLFVISIAAPTWAWLVLLKKQGYKNIRFFEAYRIWFYSFMARYIPGKVALIAARAQLCKKFHIPIMIVSNVAILEVFLFIGITIFLSLPIQVIRNKAIIGSSVIFLVLGAVCIFLLQNKKFIGMMARYLPPFRKIEPLSISPGIIVNVTFIYIVYWILRGFALIAFLSSFAKVGPGDVVKIVSGYALAYVGGILAVFTPSGLGVREIAFATLLQSIYSKELAYVIAVAVRLWVTVSEVILWAVLYILSRFTQSRTDIKENEEFY